MTEPFPDQVCATCALPVVVFHPFDRPHETSWRHTQPADHPAQPVPRDEAGQVKQICDFCSAADIAWVYQTATQLDHTLAKPTLTGRTEHRQFARHWQTQRREQGTPIDQQRHVYSPGWTACQPCADLIELRDMQRLITRVRRQQPDTIGAKPRGRLRDLYKPFFRSITGRTPQPASPTDPATPPDASTQQ